MSSAFMKWKDLEFWEEKWAVCVALLYDCSINKAIIEKVKLTDSHHRVLVSV
jgi:hypothetical protein